VGEWVKFAGYSDDNATGVGSLRTWVSHRRRPASRLVRSAGSVGHERFRMICSTCDAPVAVDSLKIWNSRTVCVDCFGVISGQAAPSQPNPENLRTIRETTVCPACQAEFHKDHPTCPECNTVLDPAFRVARQTKRAVQEVSELVVENTRTTRQIFVYVLRLLIAGFLWALVVLSAFSLIVGLLSQKATINWWGVPVSAMWFVTVIWLARRIGPGHFRPRPRLNNESASKSSAGSLKVSPTDRSVPHTAMPLHNYLAKRELETQPEAPVVEKTPQPSNPYPVSILALLLCIFVVGPIVAVIHVMISADREPHIVAPSAATPNQGELFTPTDHLDEVQHLSAATRTLNNSEKKSYDDLLRENDAVFEEGREFREWDAGHYIGRAERHKSRFRAMEIQEEAEEKARFQRLGAFEKVRETAANFLIPGSRK